MRSGYTIGDKIRRMGNVKLIYKMKKSVCAGDCCEYGCQKYFLIIMNIHKYIQERSMTVERKSDIYICICQHKQKIIELFITFY